MFNLFRPAPPRTITVSPAGRQFSARKGGVLLEEALLAGVPLPHNCTVGTCGACKCRLTEGKIVELTDFALSPLTGEELRAGYILACQSSVRTDVVIEVDLGSQADFAKVSGRVAGQTRLTSDIMGLRIVLDEPMSYRPGQYAHVGLEGVPVARSFSFATPCRPQVGQEVEFMIRLAPGGQFTEALFARDFTGEKATVEGPLGGFGLSEDEAPMLCVAGGTGLAPILAVLQHALDSGQTRDVHFFLAVRSQADLFGLERIQALAERWPANWRFAPILSAEAEDSDWTGMRGFAASALEQFNGFGGAAGHAYLCGPPIMVDSCADSLAAQGWASDRILADRFLDMSSGTQARLKDIAEAKP